MSNLKRLYMSKFNVYLLLGIALLNGLLIGLTTWKYTYYYHLTYFKFNVVQLAVILIGSFIFFFLSYKKVVKKKPDFLILIVYLFSLALLVFNLIGINVVIEHVLKRGSFSISNAIFINIMMICFAIILSNFDLPTIDNLKKGYFSIKENLYKYLGVLLVALFVVSYISLTNSTFVYALSFFPSLLNLYLLKILISNLRK